jgi:AcrR family transcriptional regulator
MTSPALGRVALRRIARKEEIFKTALRLAETEGRDGLTVHRLADALELTPGALYRYFDSKNLFLAELQHYVQSEVLKMLRKRGASWTGSGKTGALFRLLAAADFYLELEKTAPRYAILLGLLVGDPRKFQESQGLAVVAPSALELLGELESLFSEAEREKALAKGDRRERTLAYWAALHGATHLVKLDRVERGLRENRYYGIRMAKTLLTGWGAPKGDLERAWKRLDGGRR